MAFQTYFDAGAPSADLGVDQDFYIDTSTGVVWRHLAGSWTNTGLTITPGGIDPQTLASLDSIADFITEAELTAIKLQLQAQIDARALNDAVISALDLKANIQQVNTALGTKADIDQTQAKLDLKANKEEVNLALSLLSSVTETDAKIAVKADKTYVDIGLSDKVTVSELENRLSEIVLDPSDIDLSNYATNEYVDGRLATKANASSLVGKADISFVQQELATKVSIAQLEAKADKTALADLATVKADKSYVDQQIAIIVDSGGGQVSSVAGKIGVVTLNANDIAEVSNRRFITEAERTKLASVANAATANSSDAQLRDRSTHTGTQAISSIAGLQTALDDKASTSYVDTKVAGLVTQEELAEAVDGTLSPGGLADYAKLVDLDQGLDTKANKVHTHAISDITGLQTALDSKLGGGDFTNLLNTKADVSAVTGKLDRNIIQDDLAKPSVILGTVYGARWSGVVEGQDVSTAVRQANLAALQEAINYASENRKFFELEPGFYEIHGQSGLIIPPSLPFTWKGQHGSNGYSGTSIKKFKGVGDSDIGPILSIGGFSGVACEHLTLDGVSLGYGSDTAGDTTAKALCVGDMIKCHIERVDVSANWNGTGWDNAPYIGVWFDDRDDKMGFSQNVIKTLSVKGAQESLMSARLTGFSNLFQNITLANGLPGSNARPLNGPALWWSTEYASQYGNVFDQTSIIGVRSNQLLRLDTNRAVVFDGLHFDRNESTGYEPCLIHLVNSSVAITGLDIVQHRFNTADGMDAGTKGYVFKSYMGSRAEVNTFAVEMTVPGNINAEWGFIKESEPSGNYTPFLAIENFYRIGEDHGSFTPDENFDAAVFQSFYRFQTYEYGKNISKLVRPSISASGSFNVFTQYQEPEYEFPTILGQDSYVTLMEKSKHGGDLHLVPPPVGATVRIRRLASFDQEGQQIAADASRIIVKNSSNVTLATMSAAGDDLIFRWTGYQWYDAAQTPPALPSGGSGAVVASVAPPEYVLVGQRCSLPDRVATAGDGTFRQVTQNARFKLVEDCSDVRVVFDNLTSQNFGELIPGPSALTMKVGALKPLNGNPELGVFYNGENTQVVPPDGRATVQFAMPYSAGEYFLPINFSYASGTANYPTGSFAAFGNSEMNNWAVSGLYDNTNNPTYANGASSRVSNYAFFPPTAILGRPKPDAAPRARVMVWGDSITSAGSNNSQQLVGEQYAPGWMLSHLLDTNVPFINMGCSGLSLHAVMNTHTPAMRARRYRAFKGIGITHCIMTFGQNDQASGRTAAQFIADMNRLRDELAICGIKLIVTTSWPRTNNANNGPHATSNWTALNQITTHVRDNNGVGFGYIDVAKIFGNSSNENLWRTDKGGVPTDGIHPENDLHAWGRNQLALVLPNLLKV